MGAPFPTCSEERGPAGKDPFLPSCLQCCVSESGVGETWQMSQAGHRHGGWTQGLPALLPEPKQTGQVLTSRMSPVGMSMDSVPP